MLPSHRESLPWLLCLFLVAGCTVHAPGLQEYDGNKVLSYLRQHGFKGDAIHQYWQDSEGLALYFPDGDLSYRVPGHRVFILAKDRDDPIQMTIPPEMYDSYWIDPLGRIRLTPAYVPSVEKQVRENIYGAVDLQSPLFTNETRDGKVYVGSFVRPEGWVFVTPKPVDEIWLLEVTGRGNVVYLEDNVDSESPAFMHSATNCWVFAPDSSDPAKYAKVDEFSVPGVIVALDPFSPRCICRSYGPWPFNNDYFLFDTQTHRNLGSLAGGNVTAFLAGDWLGPRLKSRN